MAPTVQLELERGKHGMYYTPFPVMAMAAGSDGNTFLVAGGGGAGNVKEVPNLVFAVEFDEETQTAKTIATLNTGKKVIVSMWFSPTAGVWLASAQTGCKILSLDKSKGSIVELCEWASEEEGKEPEQNFARMSPDGKLVLTGGSDGRVKLWDLPSPLGSKPPSLHCNCGGDKLKEVLDGDFSADGSSMAVCDAGGACYVWSVDSAEESGSKITFPTPKAPVKGGVYIKLVRFCTLEGSTALILAANGGRGPGLLAICKAADGSPIAQVVADEAPLKSLLLDPTGSRLLVGITAGSKAVYSFPQLRCLKKTKALHELPAMEVIPLGEGTIVSGSGDRSLHFLDMRSRGGGLGGMCCWCLYLLIFVAVLLMLGQIGLKGAALQQGTSPEGEL
mmetsp:Transcript_52029/g.123880  ORF Transcript_52029/g.123880 Transcript_52029/m.123880 type:complete len:391 (+) Transcript_52029:82-1254(+)|eukprot:CAMPEP_0178396132 /NCGR_PEP_ID=MMETSP0689_2-20121128/13574_1 /TAXON_ID=160604 /ORGANISM="Amphidinium massartii, Strain CS-259" /LENGTH=390 /DNA_ID=CAMNT_0020016803 /DNA_START=33 /DNA_END=1205 /DNA_ORIENTATION=+